MAACLVYAIGGIVATCCFGVFGVENLFDQYYELPLGGIDIGKSANSLTQVPGMGRTSFAAVCRVGFAPAGKRRLASIIHEAIRFQATSGA